MMRPRRRLLVVEDDATVREMLELVLDDAGYEVRSVPHGAAALAVLNEVRPDVILLDMKMPVMDGWEFVRRYRARRGPRAPVIVLTAAQDDARCAAEVGARAYLAKPFAIDDLLSLIDQVAAPS